MAAAAIRRPGRDGVRRTDGFTWRGDGALTDGGIGSTMASVAHLTRGNQRAAGDERAAALARHQGRQ